MDPFGSSHLGMPQSSSGISPEQPAEKPAAALPLEPAAGSTAALSALLWFGEFLGCDMRETSRAPPHLSKDGVKKAKLSATPPESPLRPTTSTTPMRDVAAASLEDDPALNDILAEMSSCVEVAVGEDAKSACSSPPLNDMRHSHRPDTKTKAPRSRSQKVVKAATNAAAKAAPTEAMTPPPAAPAPSTMWHETTVAPMATSMAAKPGARIKRPRERLSL